MPTEPSGSIFPVSEDKGILPQYPRPRDIPNLIGCFGKHEVERSAGRLLEFFRMRNAWNSFSIQELATFYAKHIWSANEMFYGLHGTYLDDGGMMCYREPQDTYIVEVEAGRYNVTAAFIGQCSRNLQQQAA